MVRLLSSLPVGAKVVDKDTNYNSVPIVWVVGGHDHYAQGQTVLVSEKIITLKSFDAIEASNTNSGRKSSGNNRYSQSNIRQWLNSLASSWYSAQHSADAPPNNTNVWSNCNEYDAEAGFLSNFSENMRNALVPTTLTVAKNTVTDGGGSENVSDKVFLLSNTEVGLANENSIAEGERMSLFSTASNRIANPTSQAVGKSEYTDGSLSNNSAYSGNNGVRPALNLPSVISVSDNVNSNGEYEITWPYLTPSNGTDLGNVTDNTSILKYTPTAYPVGTTVTEKINGVVVGTKTIVNDTEYTVSATLAQWNAVKYGKYKDTLGNKNVVTLEVSTGEVYTYPFTKTLPTTAKTNDVLVAVNDMSNTAMASHKKKLVDAIGNKATVGGTGTLEDIAKAIEGISVESLGGIRYATGYFTTVSTRVYAVGTVHGLSFSPKAVIISSRLSERGVFFPKDYRGFTSQISGAENVDLYRGKTIDINQSLNFISFADGFEVKVSNSYMTVGERFGYIAFE